MKSPTIVHHVSAPALMLVLALAGCGGAAPSEPAAPTVAAPPPASGTRRCSVEPTASLFKRPDTTRILVADFFTQRMDVPDVADALPRRLEGGADELSKAPKDAVEVARIPCFLDGPAHAREIAEAAGADWVIWGKAFCDPQTLAVREGRPGPGGAYIVCPSVMSRRGDHPFDLPPIAAKDPSQLVNAALGLHFRRRGKLKHAALLLVRALSSPSASERNVEHIEGPLAQVLFELGEYRRSVEIGRRALERVRDTGTLFEAEVLNNLAGALHEQGDAAGALQLLRRSLSLKETLLGKGHADTAVTLNNLGRALQTLGDTAGALDCFKRALAIDEKAQGRESADVASDLNNLGSLLLEQGDSLGAIVLFERALAIHEKLLGKDHSDTAIDVSNLGSALRKRGDLPGAIAHYKRALATFERTLGPTHPMTRAARENMAGALAQQSGWPPDRTGGGVVIVGCSSGSCGGLEPGDWLVSYGTAKVRDHGHLAELMRASSRQRSVSLTVVRAKRRVTLKAESGPLAVELL